MPSIMALGAGNVIKPQEAIQRIDIDPAFYRRVFENCFDFGSKKNVISDSMEKERFDAKPVARKHQALLRLGPKRDCKHSPKTAKTTGVPLTEGL
jgi:hypothetical protein